MLIQILLVTICSKLAEGSRDIFARKLLRRRGQQIEANSHENIQDRLACNYQPKTWTVFLEFSNDF